jgi:hypothetical protein
VAALPYALASAFPFIEEISPLLRELGAKLLYTLVYMGGIGDLSLSLLYSKEPTPPTPLVALYGLLWLRGHVVSLTCALCGCLGSFSRFWGGVSHGVEFGNALHQGHEQGIFSLDFPT